ncbi:MAG: methyltransferase domain-containing protein [Planctomycetes bacterium]|nr:methyltransferase domain-containing protein [Planctomycetota bacterium]MBU4399152.1 methyltransferase domain-containing protein [Planctomycetota bacterium]
MSDARPNRQQILELANGFRPACVIGAAAELDAWTVLADRPLSAEEFAARLDCDLRATAMLLDAVAALGLLDKHDGRYSVPSELRDWLVEDGADTVLPMLRHATNTMRGWSQLAWTVKGGIPMPRPSSIRGPRADIESFIAAMHAVSGPVADEVVRRLGPLKFKHVLDVGGASGTWTLALLRAAPGATAVIFDLPEAIAQAGRRLAGSEFADRVSLVSGDFYADELPGGADFAWVSAICHQHSRQENRELFAKVFRALGRGGRIAVRDVVMDPCRTSPPQGALFAINMLVNTESGGTFTFDEFAADLRAAGFENPRLALKHEAMNSLVTAQRP